MVERLTPFHRTADDVRKFAPETVSVKAEPPAVAVSDESEVSAGTGLAVLGPWSWSAHTSRNDPWPVPP